MSRHSAFKGTRCFDRIQDAMNRFMAVSAELAEIGAAFQDTPDFSDKPPEDVALEIANTLPGSIVGRALANEGLSLIEQIEWEIHIFKQDAEVTSLANYSELAATMDKSKSFLETRKPELEQFRNGMNHLIQMATETPKRLEDYAQKIEQVLTDIERGR